MFSTYDGAKRLAKKLRKIAGTHGTELSLGQCQKAVAAAGGYRDWQHLHDSLAAGTTRTADPEILERRLRAALAMLPNGIADALVAELRPTKEAARADHFIEIPVGAIDVWLLQSRHPIFRPGSEPGLRLRQMLVNEAMATFDRATFDERTDTITFEAGNLQEIFGDVVDDPRFHTELSKVISARVFALDEASDRVRLQLLPPPREMLERNRKLLEEYSREQELQLSAPDHPPEPTKISKAQRAILELADQRPIGPEDREWTYNDLVVFEVLLASGSLALEPTRDGRWMAAITSAGQDALRTGIKPPWGTVEVAFIRCAQGRLVFVGRSFDADGAAWHEGLRHVPVDGRAVYAFARSHGLGVFGAVRTKAVPVGNAAA